MIKVSIHLTQAEEEMLRRYPIPRGDGIMSAVFRKVIEVLPPEPPNIHIGMIYVYPKGQWSNAYRVVEWDTDTRELLIERLNANRAGAAGERIIASAAKLKNELRDGTVIVISESDFETAKQGIEECRKALAR